MTHTHHLTKLVDLLELSRKRCLRPLKIEANYTSRENFMGRPVQGYTPGLGHLLLMTQNAAQRLCQVQNELVSTANCSLLVLDAYRPKRAVMDFMHWSKQPAVDDYELERKKIHYPHIEKNQLFELGYIAEDSQHCYGNTVDLVLIDAHGKLLNMGAPFDYMDELSHLTMTEKEIGREALRHREILSGAMMQFGFVPYVKEFWHFSYREKEVHEPMDIEITESLIGLNI